jgi:hypothetical protein
MVEIGDAADVDNDLRLSQTQFHGRQKTVPAGQHFSVGAMQFEQRGRFVD